MARRILGAAILLAVLSGGHLPGFARPAQAQLRYQDEVFSSVQVTTDIAYGQALDEFGQLETLHLDLYQPSEDSEPARPVVVWMHAGGFSSGDKSEMAALATRFAQRGYVSASINYRVREGLVYLACDPEAPPAGPIECPPEQVEAGLDAQHDAQAAVRWFRANATAYGIDPARLSIGGYSAGAIAALGVAYNWEDPGDSGNPGYSSMVSAAISLAGATLDDWLAPGDPPAMEVHGALDTLVPYVEATELCDRAAQVEVGCELYAIEGFGHPVFPAFEEDIISWTSSFLFRYVIKNPAGDTDGDALANDIDPDDDNDGCDDIRELQTASGTEASGGRRDPHWVWDFMDQFTGAPLSRDGVIGVGDIGAVVTRFAASGDPGADPTVPPLTATGYHTSADRSGSLPGQNAWNLQPADGNIAVGDIGAVVQQFGHDCS